ncbi:MAG: YjbH domain-containing protein [Halanaerobiaceae bacterium]|nr:YjbH domain-containing protein [Halanaerobiaceae bacterium]
MKARTLIINISVLLLMLSLDVLALDSLVSAPTADIMGNKGFISAEFIDSYRELGGLYNINSSIAVGGIIRDSNNGGDIEIGLMAKAVLVQEDEFQPAISVGLCKEDLYIAASKDLGYGFRGHFGLGNGRYGKFFLGFNKILNPVSISTPDRPSLPVINIKAEYINDEINLAVQMDLQENIKIEAGLIGMDRIKLGIGFLF